MRGRDPGSGIRNPGFCVASAFRRTVVPGSCGFRLAGRNARFAIKGSTMSDSQLTMTDPALAWYSVTNVDEVPSPALLIYPDRVEENIRRMIQIAGGTGRLRPHMKTNKLPEVIRMQMAQGILKYKCATIAEAEVAANCGVPDMLIAYQPVGPNVTRLVELIQKFPNTHFSALVDDSGAVEALSKAASAAGVTIDLLVDLDCGMHRTGIAPGADAIALYRQVVQSPGLRAAGLHVYDGHIRDTDVAKRTAACDAAFGQLESVRTQLIDAGLEVPIVVAGGTPTFPVHAKRSHVQC